MKNPTIKNLRISFLSDNGVRIGREGGGKKIEETTNA